MRLLREVDTLDMVVLVAVSELGGEIVVDGQSLSSRERYSRCGETVQRFMSTSQVKPM